MSATNHGGKGRGKDVTKTIKDRKNISSAGVQSKKRRNVSNQKDKDRPKSVQVVQSEQKQTAAATQPGQEQGQESELETFLQKSFLSSQKLKDREEQFMKANADLEKKTALLFKRADEMMKMNIETPNIKDFLTGDLSDDDDDDEDVDIDIQAPIEKKKKKPNSAATATATATAAKRKSHSKIDPLTGNHDEFISMDIERTVKELEKKMEMEVLPAEPQPGHSNGGTGTLEPDYVSEDLGSEATIRFLKAKLRVLQEEHDKLSQDMNQKEKDLAVSVSKVKEVTEINSKLEKSQQSTQQQIVKYQKLAKDSQIKCEGLEDQLVSLKREFEAQKSNFHKTAATEGAVKVRLNRALEEVDKYKTLYSRLKADTKDSTKNDKARIEELENENKILERQKGELIMAFKKQMKLIDVLKKQKIHLEAARMLTFTEEEFMKALDIGKQT